MKSIILIASHKNYIFPDDKIYIPIEVGSDFSRNCYNCKVKDNEGINISKKNPYYSELTALFWIWKNKYYINYDAVGLVHYRRYFRGNYPFDKYKILSEIDVSHYMKMYDVLVPQKRNYFIENVKSHYNNAHYEKDLIITENIIKKLYPQYYFAFEEIMKGTKLHLYNMFVMKRRLFEKYCEWLFDILFEVEKEIDVSKYDNYQKRVFGFLAERLFNVWLRYESQRENVKIKELKVINLEGEKKILKAFNLIKRKFLNEKFL